MTIFRGVKTKIDNFDYAINLSTTPGMNGWTIADTSSSGSPTYAASNEDGGGVALTFASTSEVENLCLYQNDVLHYDLAKIHQIWWIVKLSAALDSANSLAFGVASARNDVLDTVATAAWFRMEGGTSTTAVVAETDDGTNNNDDVATGETLGTTAKKFLIDFSNGLSDVRFQIDGERVAAGTTFDMGDVSAGTNVQPLLQYQKTADNNVVAVTVLQFGIVYDWAYGA